jgi:hypothetical protein
MAKPESLSKFLSLVRGRRSVYELSPESTIPDSEIEDLVKFAIKWCPSAWNVQSARAIVLFGSQHQKLWDIVDQHMASQDLNEYNKAYVSNKMRQFKSSYGTVSNAFFHAGRSQCIDTDVCVQRSCGLKTRLHWRLCYPNSHSLHQLFHSVRTPGLGCRLLSKGPPNHD